jgi:hypothetical protein
MKRTRHIVRRGFGAIAAVALVLLLVGSVVPVATADPPVQFRPIDEVGNNVANPTWGTANIHLLRGASGSHYADGISAPTGVGRPSPRTVSNAIFLQNMSVPNPTGFSDYSWTFGQFLDHDFSLTEGNQEPLPVPVPAGDPTFDPLGTGTKTLPFKRAVFDPLTGITTPREQVNHITGFIDGSNVYGSDTTRSASLRTFSGGRLKVTHTPVGDLLPFNDGTIPNAGSPEVPDLSTSLFVAGDVRSNEQPTLACMHTLFVREHNFQAALISALLPGLPDEEIFQRARQIVVAEIESITVNEFVPALLGPGVLPPYTGYKPDVNPGIAAAFSTAAYRLGHTLLSSSIQRLNEDGTSIAAGPLSLRTAFFASAPQILQTEGIEPLLRGVAAQRAQALDDKIIDDVRDFLFANAGQGGLDLVTLNLQRGRDLGLPDFNTLRTDYGLLKKTSFAQITADPVKQGVLLSLFGTVDNIDPFAGLFIEDHIPGTQTGETLRAVLLDQFTRSRDGDRFWFENTFEGLTLQVLKNVHLSDVIKRNTTIRKIQTDVFHVRN